MRAERGLALALIAIIVLQRLWLALAHPDLLHDLDAGELKHLDLALFGLPGGEDFADRWRRFAGGPENIHHGGFPVVSVIYWALSRVFEPTLFLLRLVPIAATTLAALCMALALHRRAGLTSAWVALALFAAAPPLFLKWTTTSRGGHLEGILFPMLLLLLLDRALSGGAKRWLLAGLVAGFSVFFTYLAAPAVAVLSLGALVERAGCDRKAALVGAGALAVGALIGFSPWLIGWLVLEMPYLDSVIHQTSNPNEASEVVQRGLGATVGALKDGMAHNLWPWGMTASPEAAYRSTTPDILVFEPNQLTWTVRVIVCGAVVAGAAWAIQARSALWFAVALLPAAHHLFVLRTANTVGYPDIPHRYLVIVFPAIAAAVGLSAAWKRFGVLFAGLVGVIAAAAVLQLAPWLGPPRLDQFSAWDVAAFREAGVGQVRVGEPVGPLLDVTGETANEERRGVSLVYPPIADYYLLFRDKPHDRPYPDHLFREPDPLSQNEGHRRAVARGALAATRARSTGDEFAERVCAWEPASEHVDAVNAARTEAGVSCAP